MAEEERKECYSDFYNEFSRICTGSFEIKDVVRYNYSFLGIAVNLITGLIKLLIIFPVLNHVILSVIVCCTMTFSFDSKIEYVKLINRCIVLMACLITLFDALGIRGKLSNASSYKARMPLAFLTKLSSLNVHITRIMIWFVLLISMNFDLYMYYERLDDILARNVDFVFILQFFLGPHGLFTAVIIYIVIVISIKMMFYFEFEEELSHPWLENWESGIYSKEIKYGSLAILFMIINCSFYSYYLNVCINFINYETNGKWDTNFEIIQKYIYLMSILFLVIFQMIYLIIKNHNDAFVYSSFMWNCWFIFYIQNLIVIEDGYISNQSKLHYFIFITLFCLEFIFLLILHPVSALNFFIWCIKYLTTLDMIAFLLGFIGIFIILISGVIIINSFEQDMFYVEFNWCKVIQDFANFVSQVFDALMEIFSQVGDVLGTVASVVAGLLCWVVIFTLFLTVTILVVIGFGSAIAPETTQNIMKSTEIVKKTKDFLNRLKNLFQVVYRYIKKALQLVKVISNTAKTTYIIPPELQMYIICITFFPLVFSLAILYFFVVERASVGRYKILKFIGLCLLFAITQFIILIGLDFLLSIKLNLILFKIEFIKGFKLIWMEIAFFVFIAGLVVLFGHFLLSPKSKYNLVDESTDLLDVQETVAFPGLISFFCPLFEVPKDRNSNACLVCCGRMFICGNEYEGDEFEEYSTYSTWKRICCPCFYKPVERDDLYFKKIKNGEKKHKYEFDIKRFCRCRKSYIEEKEKAKQYFKLNLEYQLIDEKSHALSVPTVPIIEDRSTLKMPKWWPSKLCDPLRLTLLPSYLIPMIFAGLALYLCYISVNSDWLNFSTLLSKFFTNVIYDESIQTSQGDMNTANNQNMVICPPIDIIASLLTLFVKGILAFLQVIFAPLGGLIEALAQLLDMIADLPFGTLLSYAAKIFLLSPIIINAFLIIFGSILLALSPSITRLDLVTMNLISFSFFLLLIYIPPLISSLMSSIPFLGITCTLEVGFYYAWQAEGAMLFGTVMLFIDHFAPIIAPKKETEIDSVLEGKERYDVFGINDYIDYALRKRKRNVDLDFSDDIKFDINDIYSFFCKLQHIIQQFFLISESKESLATSLYLNII